MTGEEREFNLADKALSLVIQEYGKATNSYGPMASAHEGYAVLKEELDELWDEIKKNPQKRDDAQMQKEAIQVAAMAIRFLVDVCLKLNE